MKRKTTKPISRSQEQIPTKQPTRNVRTRESETPHEQTITADVMENSSRLPHVTVLMDHAPDHDNKSPGGVDVNALKYEFESSMKAHSTWHYVRQHYADQVSYAGLNSDMPQLMTYPVTSADDRSQIEAGGVVSLVHATRLHRQVEENPFINHGGFTQLQALAALQGKTHHDEDKIQTQDPYQNEAHRWEQENNRYSEYSWKNQDVYSENSYNNNNNNNPSYIDCNDESFRDDQSYGPAYLSDGSSTAMSLCHGRRRRKRVQTPVQRTAANMRERRRMCHLNVAFDRLKEHLPNVKDKKKLSRIQTLKAAIYYIHLLRDSLNIV